MAKDYLKDKYLETLEARDENKTGYTVEQLWALRDMAKADVWPDGRFSDEECVVWGLFR